MRGTWSVAVLLLGMTGLACATKPRRVLREPTVQEYSLPPLSAKAFSDPPTYPEEKAELKNVKGNSGQPAVPAGLGGGGGGRSGMGGAGMGGAGMGGMGSPGMGGAGMNGPGGAGGGYR